MYQLDHILVTLDLSDMDDFLIRYCNFLAERFGPKKITFMHVVKSYDIPREVLDAFPDMEKPLKYLVQEELEEKLDELFTVPAGVEKKVIVEEGVATETILQYSKEEHVSLTLMGKKIGYQGRGSMVNKVLSLSPSSVLIISETTQHKIDHVMVRVDFSKMSEMAMKMALKLQELTGAKISCHHVYKLPIQYFARSTPENELRLQKQMEKYSSKEYAKFMKKLKLDKESIKCSFSLDKENDEAHILYNQALRTGADMILTGSKLKSGLADVILDSTSEKLAGYKKNIALFAVKDRKQTLGFLDTLFD